MSKVFISYRRQDTKWMARALKDRLCDELGKDQVFMDVDSIDLGTDFVDAIETAVAQVDVVIALIGKEWLSIEDDRGRRRLDNLNDFVRVEIATALKRDIRLVPLLERGAVMPDADDLPDDLKPLARRNALEISDVGFSEDVGRLITSLRRIWENDRQGNSVSGNEMVRELQKMMDSGADKTHEPVSSSVAASASPVAQTAEMPTPVPAARPQTRSRTRWPLWIAVLLLLAVSLAAGARFLFPDQLAEVLPPEVAELMKLQPVGDAADPASTAATATEVEEANTQDATESADAAGVEEVANAIATKNAMPIVSADSAEGTLATTSHGGLHGQPHSASPQLSTLTGTVFTDSNANGTLDDDEAVLPNIALDVTKSDQQSETIKTNGAGAYTIKVRAGETVLRVDTSASESAAAMPVVGTSESVDVQAGVDAKLDLGIQPQGTFAAMVFEDLNGNGERDDGEQGIPDIALLLSLRGAEAEPVKTDETGQYCVTMPPGQAQVVIDESDPNLPAGAKLTTELPGKMNVLGGEMANWLIGFQQQGAVQGVVFADDNGNGTQDDGEPGIPDLALNLASGEDMQQVADVVTGQDGQYNASLPTGPVFVTVDEAHPKFPAGAALTKKPSQVDLRPGRTETLNFGLRLQANFTVWVFNDLNGNGEQDAGEPGIPNVLLKVLDSERELHEFVTDKDGQFRQPLPPGNAIVAVDPKDSDLPQGAKVTSRAGHAASTQSKFEIVAGEAVTKKFGFQQQGNLSGIVFNDINGNGTQDETEPALSGVKVELIPSKGESRFLTTKAAGKYETPVQPGKIALEVDLASAELPNGSVLTTEKRREVDVQAGAEVVVNHGIQKPARLIHTKDAKPSDYEKLVKEARKDGVPVTLVLSQGPVLVRESGAQSQKLNEGSRVQIAAFQHYQGTDFLKVTSATTRQGVKQAMRGFIMVDDLAVSPTVTSVIGLDLDWRGQAPPPNWSQLAFVNESATNMPRDDGVATAVDLKMSATGSFNVNSDAPDPKTLPKHTPALSKLDGWSTCTQTVTAIWSDLQPGQSYGVYVFGFKRGAGNYVQTVTIIGDKPLPPFTQNLKDGEIRVNDEVGTNGRTLHSFEHVAAADENGRITIKIAPGAASSGISLAGLAIRDMSARAGPPANPAVRRNGPNAVPLQPQRQDTLPGRVLQPLRNLNPFGR